MSAKRSDFTAVDADESQGNEEDDAEEEEIDPNAAEDISPKKRGRPKGATSNVTSKKTYKSNKKILLT